MKERLDRLIVKKGLLGTRQHAKAYIMGGYITVNGERVIKPAVMIDEGAVIDLRIPNQGYVSRGGIKLSHALDVFCIDIRNTLCLDIGASTGGFTDCLLQRGACRVVAVDVGRNQIAYSLRVDPRVRVVEKFNARSIGQLSLDRIPDIVTIDVSFISLTRITDPLADVVDVGCSIVCLVKPQFELGKPYSGFRGVVRGVERHIRILKRVCSVIQKQGYDIIDSCYSPITGPRGNIEFFIHMRKQAGKSARDLRIASGYCDWAEEVVGEAYSFFNIHGMKITDGGRDS